VSIGLRSKGMTLDYIRDILYFTVQNQDKDGNNPGFQHNPVISGFIYPEVELEVM
jgi:glucose/arabinose dehydrogenase